MKKMLVLALALAATQALAADRYSPWSEILADRSLKADFPQITFALPDRGTMFAGVNGLCVAGQDGAQIIRHLTPYTPCLKYSYGDHEQCLKYGAPVVLERPVNYVGDVCVQYGHGERAECVQWETRELTLATSYEIPVSRRYSDDNNGPVIFTKAFTIPACR